MRRTIQPSQPDRSSDAPIPRGEGPAWVAPTWPAIRDANDPDTSDRDAQKTAWWTDARHFRPLHHVNEFPRPAQSRHLGANRLPTGRSTANKPELASFLQAWTNARSYHQTSAENYPGIVKRGALTVDHAGRGGVVAKDSPLWRDVQGKVYFGYRPEVYPGQQVIPLFLYHDAKSEADYETSVGRVTGYSHYVRQDIPIAGGPTGTARPPGYAVIQPRGESGNLHNPWGIQGEARRQILDVIRSHYVGSEESKPSLEDLDRLYQHALDEGYFGKKPDDS